MAAVLTRVLAPARNRFLRQSDHKAQPHVGSQNKRAFERNAQADVSMGEAEEEDTTAVEDEDDDPDAEGSPDVEDEFVAAPMPEADDEVAEDEDYEEEATRGVKVRKTRVRTSGGTRRRKRGVSSQEEEEEDSPGSDEESEDEEEEQEAPWAAESEEEVIKAAEVEVANPNRCVFCDQDEDNDPSPDFEEYLACAVCGDNGRLCTKQA
jgi:histone acetyltransferase SAS3